MRKQVFNDTGNPRYDLLPEGFISADPRPSEDGVCSFILEPNDIPFEALEAIAEKMNIQLIREDQIIVVFPVPYTHVHRLEWCKNVRKLAIHYNVDWPHLRNI